jgi:hypothetical protein
MKNNPFAVKSPESLSPQDIAKLFVDVFSDFPKILDIGHTFIHGARGTGKSMMLRYLEPLVQIEAQKYPNVSSLPFLAIHVPIRNAQLRLSEWNRLKGLAYEALAEHLLVAHISARTFNTLSQLCQTSCRSDEAKEFYINFINLLKSAGIVTEQVSLDDKNLNYFIALEDICDNSFTTGRNYLKRLSLAQVHIPYDGPLMGYLDLFVKAAKLIQKLSFTPNGPIYLMLDDADNLPIGLQKLVNTWVSCRTSETVCLKVSTQLNYSTYMTTDGNYIETPHDYSEVDISTIYTSNKDHYYDRVYQIVKKRLSAYDINVDPIDYFPCNEKQALAIAEIKKSLIANWKEKKLAGSGGYRASDESTRYSRPDYMKQLAGNSKSSHTYSYAGFKSLVDISSGVIRWFLEPASRMYNETLSRTKGISSVNIVPYQIQDDVINKWSEEFIISDFEKIAKTAEIESNNTLTSKNINMLFKLIDSLGQFFRKKLLNDKTERRVFSVMIADDISPELKEILQLGVEWGYFLRSTIGSKEGKGRKPLYIMNRRLAPYFKLDPCGYSHHISVTSSQLVLACSDTNKFLREKFKAKDIEQLVLPLGGAQ